uniref:Proprotein convertase subtilisin/kexin type 5-like n=1 Tax=Crassostrea virginica TaxID=6565 RepID=A0A8B8ALY5_CRAVI|nr:proprotein convertase subtilisin/kexin type 5-like [Crassostrea virginica]
MTTIEFFTVFFLLIKSVTLNCLPSEVNLEDQRKRCLKSCPKKMFMFRQTCHSECPLKTNVTETELGRFCIAEHDSECQRPSCPDDFPLCYRMNCLEECPEYTVRFGNSCVIECPSSHPFLVSNDCEGPCFTRNSTCEKKCPQSQSYLFRSFRSQHCLENCPLYTYERKDDSICELKCPKEKPFLFNKTCLNDCPASHSFVQIITTDYNTIPICSESCPADTIVDEDFCVNACPAGKKDFNNTCVKECPASHSLLLPNSMSSFSTKATFTCVEFCNVSLNYKLEYDNHCVDSCPPESNYAFNDSCHKACPMSSKYNTLSGTGYKICHDRCPKNTYISNRTNCRHSCPVEENFMYNSSCYQECPSDAMFSLLDKPYYALHFECYEKCPEDNLIFNKTKCVSSCPTEALYKINNTCVANCPKDAKYKYSYFTNNNWYSSKIFHHDCIDKCPLSTLYYQDTCVEECPSASKYVHNDTCIDTCPVEYDFKVSERNHYNCVEECPSITLLLNETYCVSSCPTEALYKVNGTCVAICPQEFRYKYTNFTTVAINWQTKDIYHHYCLNACPLPTFYDQDACVKECPEERNFLFNRSCDVDCPSSDNFRYLAGHYYKCYDECPSSSYIYNSSLCVGECPGDRNYESNGTCYQTCPKFSEFVNRVGSYFKCQNECYPLLTFNKTCLKHCPTEAKFQDKGNCVTQCNDDKRLYTFRNYTEVIEEKKIYDDFCLEECPANTFYLNFNTCVSNCTPDTLELDNICVNVCPKERPLNYTQNNGRHLCVYRCPYQTFKFRNNCFDQCPSGLKSHQGSCTLECPKSHPYTHIVSQKCLRSCENDFVITDNDICDKKCPNGKHYIEKKRCVKSCTNPAPLLQTTKQGLVCHDQCPHNLLLMENKDACVEKCPDNKLIVGSVCRELYKCPNHLYLEHTDVGKRCTNQCSKGFYLDGTHCVKECPSEMIIYENICANECPYSHRLKYKTFASTKPRVTCYRQCPVGYAANGTECIDEFTCHSVQHYTFEHVCYETCPPFSAVANDYTCVSLKDYLVAAIAILIFVGLLTGLFYLLTCYTGKRPKTSGERQTEGIKTHFQLLSKSKKNEENKKYVIRFRKEDKEEAEIVEVDNNKVDEDNVEDDKQIEDNQSQTTYRRRRAT